jgi:hypothetical protein
MTIAKRSKYIFEEFSAQSLTKLHFNEQLLVIPPNLNKQEIVTLKNSVVEIKRLSANSVRDLLKIGFNFKKLKEIIGVEYFYNWLRAEFTNNSLLNREETVNNLIQAYEYTDVDFNKDIEGLLSIQLALNKSHKKEFYIDNLEQYKALSQREINLLSLTSIPVCRDDILNYIELPLNIKNKVLDYIQATENTSSLTLVELIHNSLDANCEKPVTTQSDIYNVETKCEYLYTEDATKTVRDLDALNASVAFIILPIDNSSHTDNIHLLIRQVSNNMALGGKLFIFCSGDKLPQVILNTYSVPSLQYVWTSTCNRGELNRKVWSEPYRYIVSTQVFIVGLVKNKVFSKNSTLVPDQNKTNIVDTCKVLIKTYGFNQNILYVNLTSNQQKSLVSLENIPNYKLLIIQQK